MMILKIDFSRIIFFLNRKNFFPFNLNYAKTGATRAPPPFNVTIMKGTRYVALKRDLAQFLVQDPVTISTITLFMLRIS
jgi:hypothetical protein